MTYLDEVHAVGLYGATGAGVAEREGVADQFDLINATLGKAFGVTGGYVAGACEVIDMIRSHTPDAGEHGDEILKSVGYTDAELDDMRRKGAI